MKLVAKRDPALSINENILNKLQDAMVENLQMKRQDLPTITSCIQAYVKHEESFQVMVKTTVALDNFKKFNDVFKEM